MKRFHHEAVQSAVKELDWIQRTPPPKCKMSSVCTSSVLLRDEEFWAAEEWFYTGKRSNTSEGVIHLLEMGTKKNLFKLDCYRSILKFWK